MNLQKLSDFEPDYGPVIMALANFVESCNLGYYVDGDGCGAAVYGDCYDLESVIWPSDINRGILPDCLYIAWWDK